MAASRLNKHLKINFPHPCNTGVKQYSCFDYLYVSRAHRYKCTLKTSSCHNRDVPHPQFEVGHVGAHEWSRNRLHLWRSKQNWCTCMWGLQYMHDNLLQWHSFWWVMHTKSYLSMRTTKKIQVKHGLWNRINAGKGQNKIGGAHLHHVGCAMYA